LNKSIQLQRNSTKWGFASPWWHGSKFISVKTNRRTRPTVPYASPSQQQTWYINDPQYEVGNL